MHELRYFQEIIALSDDIDDLWFEKCEIVFNKSVRYLEGLKIYFEGRTEWLFDYLPTKRQASQYIVGKLCPPFLLAQLGFFYGIRGSAEALRNKRLKDVV